MLNVYEEKGFSLSGAKIRVCWEKGRGMVDFLLGDLLMFVFQG